MNKNELERLGWNMTRSFLKTLPEKPTGDIAKMATENLENNKIVKELLRDLPLLKEERMGHLKVGMKNAIANYYSLS